MSIKKILEEVRRKRRNGIILKPNSGPPLNLELTEFNDNPEQLLALSYKAQIEYAAALAKFEYTREREQNNEPFVEDDMEAFVDEVARRVSRQIGWE